MPLSAHCGQPEPITVAFKQAMRRLTSTVTIITTRHDGVRYGMAATAVCSVGLSPPSMLVGISENASLHSPLIEAGHFCVNLLMGVHRDLVANFSGRLKGEDRFATGGWAEGPRGLPHLVDAQASLFCTVDQVTLYAGHALVIGLVEDIRCREDVAPLLYENGRLALSQVLA